MSMIRTPSGRSNNLSDTGSIWKPARSSVAGNRISNVLVRRRLSDRRGPSTRISMADGEISVSLRSAEGGLEPTATLKDSLTT